MSHRNAPLTPTGRLRLARCIVDDRWPLRRAADRYGVSVPTAQRWAGRYREHGQAGMTDRASRPHSCPRQLDRRTERRIVGLRVCRRWGPERIAYRLGLNPSTVYKVLRRYQAPPLAWTDPATGARLRAAPKPVRYEHDAPGDLVHVDVRKLGRIPDGGGHRVHGRAKGNRIKKNTRPGMACVHNAIDDHSRLAYSEVLADEKQETTAAFWNRANDYLTGCGITVKRVLTDNGSAYRSKVFAAALGEAIAHKRTRPYRPQTNGKVERFNRTLEQEWAYACAYTSEAQRVAALPAFLHTYGHHRGHTALKATHQRAVYPTSVGTTPRPRSVLEVDQLERAVQAAFGDAEVLGNLGDGSFVFAGHCDDVTTEVERESFLHGLIASSEEQVLTGQETTRLGADHCRGIFARQRPLISLKSSTGATFTPRLSGVQVEVSSPSEVALQSLSGPTCRLCGTIAEPTFIDLGFAPPCETILTEADLDRPEAFYPLHVRVCPSCLLVQLPECLSAAEIFTDNYPYFSSFSSSWVEHARRFAVLATQRLALTERSRVVEVASNDGYLLRHFRDLGIAVCGIEPTANTAAAAREIGIPTEVVFLGKESATRLLAEQGPADLVIANNVYAHVPDVVDFTQGLAILLARDGMLTLEFPHIMHLIEERQFDTIYHEHFQYYTLLTAQRALASGGLTVVDVEELPTHGGSLRVWARHERAAQADGGASGAVIALLQRESAAGLHQLGGYAGFADQVTEVKRELLNFLLQAQAEGKTVVGYGAPGKGNTMLNFCGIRPDLLSFTVDLNHHKHGKFLPGSRIPVCAPEAIDEAKPDYILVLPWNLREEITAQLAYAREWGARLVFAIPELQIV